jgi:putative heme-binding domain-containing protein
MIHLLAFLLLCLTTNDEVVEGDPAVGVKVYAAQSCGTCHKIDGEGVDLGPDLSHIGSLSATYLKQSIREPNVVVADRYRGVTVVLASGARIRGRLDSDTESSVQLHDMNGRPRSFPKSEVKELVRETDSLMPAFVMPSTDVDNLVAYLKTRK